MNDPRYRDQLTAVIRRAWKDGDRRGMIHAGYALADWYREAGKDDVAERVNLGLATRRTQSVRWPRPDQLTALSPHQREQWAYASASPLAILTGTPGTGKTYVAAAVAKHLIESGAGQVSVVAPTGKAAVRVAESMQRCGVGIGASTIHTLLEIGRNGHDGEGWGFRRNERNPLNDRFLIVDEPSMLDADLNASLFRACQTGTHVLLAGDPYQLPPVGHGAPLRDLLAAGLPAGQLTEIKRNAGQIVKACASIKDGRDWEVTYPSKSFTPTDYENLVHLETGDAKKQAHAALSLMGDVAMQSKMERERGNCLPGSPDDPLWQTQILVATNKGSPISRRELNRAIQDRVNANPPVEGNPFRLHDKLICLRNGWHPEEGSAGNVYVANGEIGCVVGAEPGITLAEFCAPYRVVRIPMARRKAQADDDQGDDQAEEVGTGCDFDLGWAITVHKSQGSEWPTVAVVIDSSSSARRICSREWLYTAISRASKLCLTIGQLSAARMMARRPQLTMRKTFLKELLTEVPHA